MIDVHEWWESFHKWYLHITKMCAFKCFEVYFKYLTILFVNYASIKLGGGESTMITPQKKEMKKLEFFPPLKEET